MKKYTVVSVAEDLIGFNKEVNIYLDEGWELAGGISITYDPEDNLLFFAQAMAIEDKE